MKENLYTSEEKRKELALQIARESVVLLKNDDLLPLCPGPAALFGRGIYTPALGGMGSGMSFPGKDIPSLSDALRGVGILPEEGLDRFYREFFEQVPQEDPFAELMSAMESNPDLVASGVLYELFGQYSAQPEEISVPKERIAAAARSCDRAILCFSRSTGGEECDRRIENDYLLLESEQELIREVCGAFRQVILLVNTNGLTDLSWISEYPSIKAVLFIGAGGEMGPAAAAELLVGKDSPSGKLAFTIAESYEAYPTSKDFCFDKNQPETILCYKDYGLDAAANGSIGFQKSPVTVYRENLYLGYRFFDSFDRPVLYPFGFGLSYASFAWDSATVSLDEASECLSLSAELRNTSSNYTGKETLQLYVSSPSLTLEQPYQSFKGCAKTRLLAPGEHENLTIRLPLRELASYDEASASWMLESGEYILRLGVSSRDTRIAAILEVPERIVCETVQNRLGLRECNRGRIDFLSAKGRRGLLNEYDAEDRALAPRLCILPSMIQTRGLSDTQRSEKNRSGSDIVTLRDVAEGKASIPDLTSQLSDRELAALCVGYGPGLPFAGPLGSEARASVQDENGEDLTLNTHPTGAPGYVSPAMPKYGIVSICYKDGPASCGKLAWPTSMTMACCFDTTLLYAFGSACAREAEEQGVDVWLAPALNLHRNPIGGRNFEYYSEDPYLTGLYGAAVCAGAAETSAVTCCPKHFALNEQETYRRGSERMRYDAVDSIASERTIRELYLKPFEMAVKYADVRTVMTAFNKINGIFCSASEELNIGILREEWGYRGLVITDWGDMDIVADGANAIAAGNDVIMPGGPPVIQQIEQGLKERRVTRAELEKAVEHLLYTVMRTGSFTRKGEN